MAHAGIQDIRISLHQMLQFFCWRPAEHLRMVSNQGAATRRPSLAVVVAHFQVGSSWERGRRVRESKRHPENPPGPAVNPQVRIVWCGLGRIPTGALVGGTDNWNRRTSLVADRNNRRVSPGWLKEEGSSVGEGNTYLPCVEACRRSTWNGRFLALGGGHRDAPSVVCD